MSYFLESRDAPASDCFERELTLLLFFDSTFLIILVFSSLNYLEVWIEILFKFDEKLHGLYLNSKTNFDLPC